MGSISPIDSSLNSTFAAANDPDPTMMNSWGTVDTATPLRCSNQSRTMEHHTESSVRYAGWRVVAASMVALAFGPSTIAVMSLGLFIPSLEKDFGWPRTDIALATTIVSYMIVIVSPLQGYLMDRYGARRVMLPSIPAFALGIASLSLIPPVHWVYYTAWVIVPVLGIGLFPLAYLRTVGTWFTRRLGLALGLANCGIGIGGSVIPLIAGGLIAAWSWRRAYLGSCLI